jgi:hypothetical protein
MYCSASLFLNKWTLRSFGKISTSDGTKCFVPIPYSENSNFSVAGEDPEGAKCLFLCCEKRYLVSEMV